MSSDKQYKLTQRLHQKADPFSSYNRRLERKEDEDFKQMSEKMDAERRRFERFAPLFGFAIFAAFLWFVWSLNSLAQAVHKLAPIMQTIVEGP